MVAILQGVRLIIDPNFSIHVVTTHPLLHMYMCPLAFLIILLLFAQVLFDVTALYQKLS